MQDLSEITHINNVQSHCQFIKRFARLRITENSFYSDIGQLGALPHAAVDLENDGIARHHKAGEMCTSPSS